MCAGRGSADLWFNRVFGLSARQIFPDHWESRVFGLFNRHNLHDDSRHQLYGLSIRYVNEPRVMAPNRSAVLVRELPSQYVFDREAEGACQIQLFPCRNTSFVNKYGLIGGVWSLCCRLQLQMNMPLRFRSNTY